jgi:phosphate-selective porin OprO/OprP
MDRRRTPACDPTPRGPRRRRALALAAVLAVLGAGQECASAALAGAAPNVRPNAAPDPRTPAISILPPTRLPSSPAQHFARVVESDPLTAEASGAQQAYFQTDTNEGLTLPDLHERLKKVEADQSKASAADAKKKQGFEHNIFGRIQADSATFSQDPANKRQLGDIPNGVDFRRVRMGIQGKGYEVWSYRLEVDFVQADAQTKQRPRITDCYGELHELPWLGTLRLGQFREPFSIERITSANDLTFIERGLPQAFNPARKLGAMAYDHSQNEMWYWWNGVFAQNSTDFGEQFGNAGRYAVVNRLVWLPWYDQASGGRYLTQFGAAYTYQRVADQTRKFSSTPEVSLQFNANSVIPSFVNTGNILMNDYQISHVETSTVFGPLSFQAEYYGTFVNQVAGPQVFLHGAYAYVSYFLTGENRVYDRNQGLYVATRPYSDFFRVRGNRGVAMGPGAWEVAARVSTLNLSDRNIQGGQLTDITFGVNWYLNFQTKLMFNYVHAFLNQKNVASNADVLVTRAQVVW